VGKKSGEFSSPLEPLIRFVGFKSRCIRVDERMGVQKTDQKKGSGVFSFSFFFYYFFYFCSRPVLETRMVIGEYSYDVTAFKGRSDRCCKVKV
jgi:hypothetical protein